MANAFVHIELNSNNVASAREFYGKLLDWKLEDTQMGPGMTYTMIKVGDDGTGGGMFQNPINGGSLWIPYVAVDDVAAATAKAKDLGGTVHVDNQEIPNMGRFSIITDPSGGTIGLWESADD